MSDYLRIEHVTKRFAGVTAVDDADFGIERGEFFSLLGPSGCGKTTLLRMIAGFEFPTSGEIYVEGARITDTPPHKRPSNMVFQSYAIFPHLNVFDNIAYGLRRERLTKSELAARVNNALAMIKLEGFGGRGADELSGGQRQRVALARALVRRPKVLLLDEPLGALDKRLREAMQIELRQLQKSVGITFVFVTHDQEEALSMSDRIAVMSGGKIQQIATPRVLYEAPNCREVADFIGEMNFFDGAVKSRGGDAAEIDAGPIGVVRAAAPAGGRVLVALRPEKIMLSADAAPGGVAGKVVAAAYLGERSHYTVAIAGRNEPVAVAAQNAEKIVTRGHAPGDAVYLSWAPDAVVVLPAD
ncbi:MAG: ABC transporter ATP-binding protein [Alphaproteobacteria bacterium]|nr:ABC transporter ATP-binding protein [Alphaproteobacteria bacterium]MBV9903546.1 ABC transporter ATP-binding protein [Alphaproteobacteria bacterium]